MLLQSKCILHMYSYEVRWSTKYSCKVCYICVFQWNMNAFAVHNFCLLVPNRASDIITSPLRIVTLLGDSLHYQVLRRVPRWCSSIVFSSHPTQHSAIAVTVLIEMFLVYHKYPSTSTALLILFGFCTGYVVWWVAKLGCLSHCYVPLYILHSGNMCGVHVHTYYDVYM